MNSVPDLHRQEKDAVNRDTRHSSTVLTHVFNTGRDKKENKSDSDQNCPQISREAEPPAQSQQKGKNRHLRSNSDRRVKDTAERLRTCQTHQRVDVLNTAHKDVAMLHEFKPHLHNVEGTPPAQTVAVPCHSVDIAEVVQGSPQESVQHRTL